MGLLFFLGPEYYTVLVANGLRIHNIHKNAHSSIKLALKNVHHRVALPSEEGDEYRFMVVRHPLDRIVSCWSFFCQRDKRQLQDYMTKIGYYQWMPFDEFLEIILQEHPKNVHTQKQILFTGGFEMDELCPIEKLNDRWPGLAEEFELGQLPESHNSSPHESDWSIYYTDEQRERAEKIFKEDVALYKIALEEYNG